ncbi:unnamed protein product [Peronospora belbahrii]|uniref:Uncharacterized protein n=1 Tax=Peronospora belbahrii TaxID=622444 RepID=A0AAU9L0L4_9STRA|nr:unnamed protein product [Peronospora belbahrii]
MVLKGEHGRLGLIVLVKWANSEPLWNGWSKGVGRKRSFIWVFLAATLDLAEGLLTRVHHFSVITNMLSNTKERVVQITTFCNNEFYFFDHSQRSCAVPELDEVQCLVDNGKSAALCLVHF